MSIAPGARLGAYEVVALIGAGGMGEVYRARDPRLGRDVAIKMLPAAFASDPERLDRFEQEARAAAALNHPNILAIHDIGRHPSTDSAQAAPYLVSELLDGETLRERLQDSALPVRKAMEYGVQIAKGLAAAHEKGIVHRDLKPENLFITTDDRVKILDFGLAKLTQPDPVFAGATNLPTTPPNTLPGMVLGTIGYMAPEQVRGLSADHRADIFAFGAILYEMLSGQRAFRGETAIDSMTAILKEHPPELPSIERHIPPALERIVRRCLEKSPAARFKSADDLAFALESLSSHSDVASAMATPVKPVILARLAWPAAAVFFVASLALGLLAYVRGGAAPTTPEMRLQIVTPPDANAFFFALSPDGAKFVFGARGQLWLRALGSETAQPLAGTETAGANGMLFWSPDSRSIGFLSGTQLKRIDLDAGLVQVLASAPNLVGGGWNQEGTILFVPSPSTPVMRIGAGGGTPTEATHLDPPRQISHRFPEFLPDGRHFLFLAMGPLEGRGVYVGSLDSFETRRLFATDVPAKFLPPDRVLFMREGALLAQRLNLDTLQMEGDPAPVASRVTLAPSGYNALAVSTSPSGMLAYRANDEERQLVWVDRSGRQTSTLGQPDDAQATGRSFSPDGHTMALQRTVNGNSDIWLVDMERGVPRRFTLEAVRERSPIWSPDGSRIAFASERTGVFDIYERAVDGPPTDTLLVASSEAKVVEDWSPDGRFVLYQVQDPQGGRDLWAVPTDGDRKPLPVVVTPFAEFSGRFSPDGHWITYTSNETGSNEVFVQPFPGPGRKLQISTGGGSAPQWRRDGRELFYTGGDRRVMAVPITLGGDALKDGTPVGLFTPPVGSGFQASPDGQRFLVSTIAADPAPITVLLNWAGLRAR